MNDQTLVELAILTTQQQYGASSTYLTDTLYIPVGAVLRGHAQLTAKQREKLRFLFTDYEWMLAQKIAVLAASDPDVRNVAWRYQDAKLQIAKKWLTSPLLATSYSKQPRANGTVSVHLQLRLQYGDHGLEDILDFVVSSQEAKQLQSDKLDLLTWTNQQIADNASSK
ncbi:hypothetical protein [Lacticaseibacillus mingshuiensis]|uniref:hypothetical protein n=1 Tax=Lacticaseibacillus mingshuiensis TaxID=2799574 RepID=UPI001950640D|nr:hypothetical protein [Lacticaseibacillus mingshuiensis]